MPWQIVLIVVAAAVSGTALRMIVGFIARSGPVTLVARRKRQSERWG
jgi:hypothetical protein